MAKGDIGVGDKVVAIKDGGHDREGRPFQRPKRGEVHTITSIYQMRYGLGCTLAGLDPSPYRGYFLYVNRKGPTVKQGWYFEKIEAADEEFTALLYDYLRSKDHGRTEEPVASARSALRAKLLPQSCGGLWTPSGQDSRAGQRLLARSRAGVAATARDS